MFSFLGKTHAPVPSSVHALVGAQLTEMSSYPAMAPPQISGGVCQKVKIEKDFPQRLVPTNRCIAAQQAGFIFQALEGAHAFINNPTDSRFDVWSLQKDKMTTTKQMLASSGLNTTPSNWINYNVVDAACLTPVRLLVAVSFLDPRPKLGLYVYNVPERKFTLLAEADVNAHDSNKYFEQLILQPNESLVAYYSDTKRKSAEIYHNYYNHVVLFNERYPNGIEILKLGIDNGNIVKWQVLDKKLLLHTRDNRDHKAPVVRNWSLDISQVLID